MPNSDSATAHSDSQAELNRRTHLNLFQKTIYGSGALADGMASAGLGSFLFFYMTAVCGLSGSMAGASVVIALLVDSIADPLIGSLSDNTHSRFGRRHPWMLAAALPLALSIGLLFSAPALLTGWPLFVYLTLATIGVRVSLSLFAVPHVALGAELSDDYAQRSSIVAYRVIFSVIAAIVGPALVFVVFMPTTNALLHRSGYVPWAWSCAAIALVAALACTFGTREMLSRLHVTMAPAGKPLLRFFREMRDIFRHRHFVILFAGSLIYFTSQGITTQLGLHNAKFFWQLSNGNIQLLTTVGALGALAGFPLTFWLQRHFEKHHLLMVTLLLTCAGAAITPLLRIAGIIPAVGPGLIVPLLLLRILDGGAQVLIAVTYYSMTADAADEHEYLFHARREGLFFAGLAFTSKAASALGAFIAGRALDLIGFPSAIAAKGPNLHIPSQTILELALITGPGAALIMAVAPLLVFFISATRADLIRMQQELSERRQTENADNFEAAAGNATNGETVRLATAATGATSGK